MAEQDFYINHLLHDPERFADFFNGQIYGGKQVLRASDLEIMEARNGIPFWNQEDGNKIVQRQRDVVMKAEFGVCFAILGVENQSGIHYAMPIRTMLYDALDYADQVRKLEKAHKEAGDKLKGDEFLSGITKTDRIIPVVTVVLYYGTKAWDGGKSLYEMMGIETMDADSIKAILSLLGENERILSVMKTGRNKEGFDMCQAIDELIQDGEQRGEQRGEQQGESRLSSLILKLLKDGRQDLMEQAVTDQTLRKRLYSEYHL